MRLAAASLLCCSLSSALLVTPAPTLHVVYINLDSRPDRRDALESQLAAVGWPAGLVHRLPASAEADGLLGCTRSHARALALAQAQAWPAVAVLEDDVAWRDARRVRAALARFLRWAAAGGAWDVVLLSGIRREVALEPAPPAPAHAHATAHATAQTAAESGGSDVGAGAAGSRAASGDAGLRAAANYQTTAAYIVRGGYLSVLAAAARDAAARMAAQGPARHAYNSFDQAWKALQHRDAWLHFEPMLADQSPGLSDITGRHADYARDYRSFEEARAILARAVAGGRAAAPEDLNRRPGEPAYVLEWESNSYYGQPRLGAAGAEVLRGGIVPTPTPTPMPTRTPTPTPTPTLAPPAAAHVARRHVVIELGSNIGDWMVPFLAAHPGAVPVMVEALPRFAPALAALAAAHGGAFYAAVAWSADAGDMAFHEAADGDAAVASSVYAAHVEAAGARGARHAVRSVDIVALLEAHVAPGDEVTLRMDIEGAEYEVLRRLLVAGRACGLARLDVETHSQFAPALGRFYLLELTLGWLLAGCAGGGPRLTLTQQRGALPPHGTISQHVPGCSACAWTQERAWYGEVEGE